MMGLGNIVWVPLSNIFGRRPVLVASTLLLTLSAMWGGLAKGCDSLLAARIFQGFGTAAADTVAPTLVVEVYFLDELGRAMVRPTPYRLPKK
jgi:MFS family permease